MVDAIYWLIHQIIWFYIFLMLVWIILSWLLALNVINRGNQFIQGLYVGLGRLFEPALRPIRRLLPDLGGLDISPVILFFLLGFVDKVFLWLRNLMTPTPF